MENYTSEEQWGTSPKFKNVEAFLDDNVPAMTDLTKYYIDLSKLSEEGQKDIFSLLPECCGNGQYVYNAEFAKHLKYNSYHQSWVTGLFSNDKRLKELTYPEFIKLFEVVETIKSDNTQTLQNALKQIEKLKADKEELLEALDEINSKLNNIHLTDDRLTAIYNTNRSLIQKMKQ